MLLEAAAATDGKKSGNVADGRSETKKSKTNSPVVPLLESEFCMKDIVNQL